MEITDEMIACYVEGSATVEEQKKVREYLSQHPEEQERVIYLMDLDRDDYLNEEECDYIDKMTSDEHSLCDIALSAAAFAPTMQLHSHSDKNALINKTDKTIERLNSLWKELDI